MSSIDIYKRALELSESGQPFVLASVIVAQGSTPQKAGANAVFEAAGGIAGTLGGGCLEAESRWRALQALDAGAAEVFDLKLDDVDISVDHIRNLYVTDGYNRRRFSLFRDAKHLSPRMTAIMLLRGQIEDRIAANYSSEVADELKKMGGTAVHGVFLDKRIKKEARRIILAGRKQREAAKKNGASKQDLAALLKEAEENAQRALEKLAAKIKAEAATKKATEHHH